MRPPLNAGENRVLADGGDDGDDASMRPPLNAGENPPARAPKAPADIASMRPPLNAGENGPRRARRKAECLGFNEAPAERGGKPAVSAGVSMSATGLQ